MAEPSFLRRNDPDQVQAVGDLEPPSQPGDTGLPRGKFGMMLSQITLAVRDEPANS